MEFKNIPPELTGLTPCLRCASEHSSRDPVVTYYCLLYAIQKGLTITNKSVEVKAFLNSIMDKLEEWKDSHNNIEEVKNETLGVPHVEQYALRLFSVANQKDLSADFGPATIKLFLTSATLLDVVSGLSEVGEEVEKVRKYAKWKAVNISKCLKAGEVPVSGPISDTDAAEMPNIPGTSFPMNPPKTSNIQLPDPPKTNHLPTSSEFNTDSNTDSNEGLSVAEWSMIEKHLNYALSAANYQDKKTVLSNLTRVLNILQGSN